VLTVRKGVSKYMGKTRNKIWFLILLIFIVILLNSSLTREGLKEQPVDHKTTTSTKSYMTSLKINYPGYEESPIRIGYIEEKDGQFYEGVIERKSYTSDKPGQTRISYEGEMFQLDTTEVEPGFTWIEISCQLDVDNPDDPPLQKEAIIKFKDRLYKGTMDLELGKEIDFGRKKAFYFGKLFYDKNLVDSDITE